MTTKPTIDKILAEALELHEKGVSLHSIVRIYPDYREAIEGLFGTMATISLEKEKIAVPKEGLERLLAALPETEPAAPAKNPVVSPFTTFMSGIRLSSLKFVLPIAALALLTGGLVLHEDSSTPTVVAPMTPQNSSAPATSGEQVATATPSASAKKAATPGTATPSGPTAAPMMMAAGAPSGSATDRMVASFSQEAAQEATIAQQNDDDTSNAAASQKAISTDPTTPNGN